MRNGLLVIAYMVVFALMVFSYESWSDDNLVVTAVVAVFLFAGLALWVYVAQKFRGSNDDRE